MPGRIVLPRILVIEDDNEVRLMVRQMLERAGHEVAEAINGDEGVESYRQRPVDLVITDILMPGKDGVETIRELRRDFPEVRIIAMTGFRGTFSRLPAAEYLGAKRTLVKPFSSKQLLDAVDETLAEDS